jgi:tetratricopeptide (TPR) repeat protein
VAFLEGKLDEAQELLNKALTHLADDDDIFLAIAYTDLAEIALAKKEFEKAHGFLTQAFWPAHNQVRRLMVFLTALTGYMLLFPAEDNSKTIEFFGALSGLSESSGVVLARFYVDLNEKRSQSARKQCSPADWDKKFRAGRQWKRNDILAQASLVLRL